MVAGIKPVAELDGTCTHKDCLIGNGRGTYRLNGGCYNCGSDVTGTFTKGHEPSIMELCPVCECRRLHWDGLAADAAEAT